MEKLIELLNEWQQSFNPWYEYTYKYSEESAREDLNKLSQLKLFIKWLVDNNKINKRKIDTRLVRYVENHYDEEWYWVESSYEDYSDTNTLLMLLSISDTPIEDLCGYLKDDATEKVDKLLDGAKRTCENIWI